MKKTIQFSIIHVLLVIVAGVGLFSFVRYPGAHRFQVLLDNKVIMEQYADSRTAVPKVHLDPAAGYRQLTINYTECGRTVSGRMLTIKDEADKVLKVWKYEGTTSGYEDPMSCNVSDILALEQKGRDRVKLCYSSKDFPEGGAVVWLVLGAESTAKK